MCSLVLTLGAVASFDFLSIGDWGDSGAKQVAPVMGKYDPEFVLAIGDNFYSKGVKSVDDPQFQEKFNSTFTAPSLQVPWYVCSGNHDYAGGIKSVDAEIEYSNVSSRWNFPSYYYSKDWEGKDGTTVTLVAIDTTRINSGNDFVAWDIESNTGVLRDVEAVHQAHAAGKIDSVYRDTLINTFPAAGEGFEPQKGTDDVQLKWIDEVLTNSTADWKFVFGHFPVHSCSVHEHGDTPSLIKYLEPILQKHNSTGNIAYFSGHDHILQHIEQNGVNFFGSGAGAREHTEINDKYVGLQATQLGTYGFMHHTLSKKEFTTNFINPSGNVTYTVTLKSK